MICHTMQRKIKILEALCIPHFHEVLFLHVVSEIRYFCYKFACPLDSIRTIIYSDKLITLSSFQPEIPHFLHVFIYIALKVCSLFHYTFKHIQQQPKNNFNDLILSSFEPPPSFHSIRTFTKLKRAKSIHINYLMFFTGTQKIASGDVEKKSLRDDGKKGSCTFLPSS